ncbi:MAG: MqnA/MqnD/SBP family protein [Chitinophagales bacterium]
MRGVTVETTSGHENDIRLLKAHFDAEIETMEFFMLQLFDATNSFRSVAQYQQYEPPCPNDTFLFDAMIHRRTIYGRTEFDVQHHDVETLNKELVAAGILDISKLSYHAYAYVSENIFCCTQVGLGPGMRTLRDHKDIIPESKIPYCLIGIPGSLTTANFCSA